MQRSAIAIRICEPLGVVELPQRRSNRHSALYLTGLALHPASLLRRACRPDEIYYVVAAKEFRELIERLHARPRTPNMKQPNFFIVGAPKAGTTSLYTYLDQHPQVYMSPLKDPNFFC